MMHPGGHPPHGAPMHPHMPGPAVPMHIHGHPGNGGPPHHHHHPMSPHASRYMRQGSAPMPHHHMPPSPHMHSPG